jgi:hypothetical protein
VIFALCIGGYEVKHYVKTKYKLKTNKNIGDVEGKKYILITDLHNSEFGPDNIRLLNDINKISPDGIFVAGDLIVGGKNSDMKVGINFINNLAKNYTVYFSLGNHEERMQEFPEKYNNKFQELMEKFDDRIIVLNNDFVDLNENVRITGFVADNSYFAKFKNIKMEPSYIENKVGICNTEKFNILMAHNPEYFDAYEKWGADLVLAGHNHGGIVRFPFLGGVISPQYKIFDKYDRGIFKINESQMVLSAGLGSHTINLRYNNRPELIEFQIIKNC